jgi:glycosyltransferase involved in cell wall biosynthesis
LDPPIHFLREALASVVAQEYRPLEVILANDGSGPEAVDAARQFVGAAGVSARYVEHTGGMNRGSSATRNLGAAAARGELLAFLDADDVWVPAKVAEQAAILEGDPNLAMVFGLTRYWHSWQRHEARAPSDFVVDRGVERAVTFAPPEFVPRFLRGRIIVPSSSNIMVRREAFLRIGGFEEGFRGMYDDQAFHVKLGLSHRVAAVPRCWDNYRQHADSMTARAYDTGAEDEARRAFLNWVREYCSRNGVTAPEVWEAINKETWLLGTMAANGRSNARGTARRLRKWALRLDGSLLPAAVRRRIWGRP